MTKADYPQYTIRVYALLINEEDEILLMNETYRGVTFTKFPGGGLEFGEGILDCVKRELHEELGLKKVKLEQFYTTDFFVNSYFDTNVQVISIYYKCIEPIKKEAIKLTTKDSRLLGMKWVPLESLKKRDVTFPIDKRVVGMIVD